MDPNINEKWGEVIKMYPYQTKLNTFTTILHYSFEPLKERHLRFAQLPPQLDLPRAMALIKNSVVIGL